GIAPEPARHSGERLPADELADLAANRPPLDVDDVHRHPQPPPPQRTPLYRLSNGRREKARADLGAAGAVDDRTAPPADNLVQPAIRLWVPPLARRHEGA